MDFDHIFVFESLKLKATVIILTSLIEYQL